MLFAPPLVNSFGPGMKDVFFFSSCAIFTTASSGMSCNSANSIIILCFAALSNLFYILNFLASDNWSKANAIIREDSVLIK